MARLTKVEKELEKKSEAIYYKYFNCVPVNLMKLGEISEKIKTILVNGLDLDSSMNELVNKYRINN